MRGTFDLLAHALKIKFRLPRDRPTDSELRLIVEDAERLLQLKQLLSVPKALTDSEWEEIVFRHVNFTGRWLYEGLDHADLNRLLAQLAAEARASAKK